MGAADTVEVRKYKLTETKYIYYWMALSGL